MKNIDLITKEQFTQVYNKHETNKFVKFMYDHLSKGATKNWLRYMMLSIFLLGNVLGIYLDVNNYPTNIKLPVILIANGFFAIVIICAFISTFMNNRRITKIAKELNITIEEYNLLSIKFLS